MKIFNKIIAAATFFLAFSACQKDGELLTVTLPDGNMDFSADKTAMDLNGYSDGALVLTLSWSEAAVTPEVSNPDVSLQDDIVEIYLQMSTSEDFASYYEMEMDSKVNTVQFTAMELNNAVLRLGISGTSEVYMRLAAILGANTEPSYSEYIAMTVTPKQVDMTAMTLITSAEDKVAGEGVTLGVLHSTDANPDLYEGFIVSVGWRNFWCYEADGTRWGNLGEDDKTYYISSEETAWNCWSSAASGCLYFFVDTADKEWWHVHIPSVDISGDGVTATMRFSSSTGLWTGVFTTVSDNTTVTLSGTGHEYNTSTGDGSYEEVGFVLDAASDGTFGFGYASESSARGIVIPEAGTWQLTLDVNTGKYSIEESDEPVATYPASVSAYYYRNGGDNAKLALANALSGTETDGVFEGFIYTDPDWNENYSNFRFETSDGDVYGTEGSGDPSVYQLSASGWNIWSLTPGMNYVTVDLSSMTWSEVSATPVRISGAFNGWALSEMNFNLSTGKWEIECEFSEPGNFKFVIDRASTPEMWEWKYADTDGDLTLSRVTDDASNTYVSTAGTYLISLDFSSYEAPTYTMTQKNR